MGDIPVRGLDRPEVLRRQGDCTVTHFSTGQITSVQCSSLNSTACYFPALLCTALHCYALMSSAHKRRDPSRHLFVDTSVLVVFRDVKTS